MNTCKPIQSLNSAAASNRYHTLPFLCPSPLSCRDREQVPLCLVGLLHQAPDPHGSASRASISGTCSSVWRMRDLPVAPISSTRAFSNRLDVKEERWGGGGGGGQETMKCMERPTAPTTDREHKRLLYVKRRRKGDLAHYKVYQIHLITWNTIVAILDGLSTSLLI